MSQLNEKTSKPHKAGRESNISNEWNVLKEKLKDMSSAMEMFNNEEAKKAYDHALHFMKVCETKM